MYTGCVFNQLSLQMERSGLQEKTKAHVERKTGFA